MVAQAQERMHGDGHNLVRCFGCYLLDFDAALAEFVREQEINAERSSSMMKLGALRVEQGELGEAERLYRRGIELEPRFSATRFPWIERGGVFVTANLRGGPAARCVRSMLMYGAMPVPVPIRIRLASRSSGTSKTGPYGPASSIASPGGPSPPRTRATTM